MNSIADIGECINSGTKVTTYDTISQFLGHKSSKIWCLFGSFVQQKLRVSQPVTEQTRGAANATLMQKEQLQGRLHWPMAQLHTWDSWKKTLNQILPRHEATCRYTVHNSIAYLYKYALSLQTISMMCSNCRDEKIQTGFLTNQPPLFLLINT